MRIYLFNAFYIDKNKNVEIKFSAHDVFLDSSQSGTLKSKDWNVK